MHKDPGGWGGVEGSDQSRFYIQYVIKSSQVYTYAIRWTLCFILLSD